MTCVASVPGSVRFVGAARSPTERFPSSDGNEPRGTRPRASAAYSPLNKGTEHATRALCAGRAKLPGARRGGVVQLVNNSLARPRTASAADDGAQGDKGHGAMAEKAHELYSAGVETPVR